MLARDRHFYTADIRLADYGDVIMIGDEDAVERLLRVIREHAQHEFVSIETEPEPDRV